MVASLASKTISSWITRRVSKTTGNYDPTIACTGPGFGCWTTDKSREQPLGKMLSYLDAVAAIHSQTMI